MTGFGENLSNYQWVL